MWIIRRLNLKGEILTSSEEKGVGKVGKVSEKKGSLVRELVCGN